MHTTNKMRKVFLSSCRVLLCSLGLLLLTQISAQTTLRFFTIFDAPTTEQWEPIFRAYMDANPDIRIAHETVAGSGAAIYPDVLRTSIAAGDPPDVFFMWGGEIAGPFIDAGQVLELSEYYEQYGWSDVVAPWTIDRITRNEGLYGVPFRARGMGFWYRTDIFAEHGLSEPESYAELEELCTTLKENGIYCATVGGRFGWHTMRILDYILEVTCGPEMHDQLNRLEASWNDPCVIEAYTRFKHWVDEGWLVPDFLNVAPTDARWPMYLGDAAMILEGDWFEGVLINDEQDISNFDFFLPPTGHEPLRFSAFPEQWMIAANSRNPDEAAAFINWLTRPETQAEFPAVFNASATIGIEPDCNEFPNTCKWREIITTSEASYPPTDQAFTNELMDDFFEVQDGIVAGQLTPEEGAALMQQRVEEWQARTTASR
jgi:raffinose/stachyose/melibiose transport system substrate-binding protein